MCALEGCGSSYDAQRSTYRNVKWAPFSCHDEIYHLLRTPGSLLSVVAQSIVKPGLMNRATFSSLRGAQRRSNPQKRARNDTALVRSYWGQPFPEVHDELGIGEVTL